MIIILQLFITLFWIKYNIIYNENFCRKALPHIKSEYFQGPDKSVYELIVSFIEKYNKLPDSKVLSIEFQKSEMAGNQDANEVHSLITNLEDEKSDCDWLLDTTESWCKDRALHLAVMECITIIDGKHQDKAEGAMPDILDKAL